MACNKEKLYPGEKKKLMPGCGAMTAPIEWCTGRMCDYVICKSNTLTLEILIQQENIEVNRFLVVGDTYESDKIMANCFGAKSIPISETDQSNAITVQSIKEVPNIIK